MSIKSSLILSYSFLVLGIVALSVLTYLNNQNQIALAAKYEQRYQSYLLADELRQTADDLTRTARTYAVTDNLLYAQMYQTIVGIRDGKQARPQHYERIYWDLVLNATDKPRPDTQAVSLQTLLQEVGLTTTERAKLEEVQDHAETVAQIETVALHAAKGQFDDGTGQFNRFAEPDLALAQRLLHDETYHKHKAEMMRPLNELFSLLSQRTQGEIVQYQQYGSGLLRSAQMLGGFLVVLNIIIGVMVTRRVLHNVGGEPNVIASIAQKIARGEFDVIDSHHTRKTTGALASIVAMVTTLQQFFQEIRGNLQRLKAGQGVWFEMPLSGAFVKIQNALEDTAVTLNQATAETERQNWLKGGQTQLNEQLSGEQDLPSMAERVLNFLTPYINAQVSAFYVLKHDADEPYLHIVATHALAKRKYSDHRFSLGESLVGQAAYERKLFVVKQAPAEYVPIQSGLGEAKPRSILFCPLLYEEEVKGVLEFASFKIFNELQLELLQQAALSIAIAVNTAQSRDAMQKLLDQSQTQATELQEQRSRLEESNARLQEQAEELQAQQEELRQTNEELEERGKLLQRQQRDVEEKNSALEKTKLRLQTKAEELALASKYKSEFLANMSHELRTPLNSMLILAQLLAENPEHNLSSQQVEAAQTIHDSGTDLLTLINDILDLSKVEAGKIEIQPERCTFNAIIGTLRQQFNPIATKTGVAFNVEPATGLPDHFISDQQRLLQVLVNLLSNAFKFTKQGSVTLSIRRPLATEVLQRSELTPKSTLVFCVTDTGIGIPPNKQQHIFEAFQQADGATNRKYGGTGLGLSISRQLMQLLRGEIHLHSKEGEGSQFCVFIPQHLELPAETSSFTSFDNADSATVSSTSDSTAVATSDVVMTEPHSQTDVDIQDDRLDLQTGDKSLLIIEDDTEFATLLANLAREKGFKCLLAYDGHNGLALAKQFLPSAIMLDVGLPQLDGWGVMDKLKEDPTTRHIPVHFLSGQDYEQQAMARGAIGYAFKPVNLEQIGTAFEHIKEFIETETKQLLIAADHARQVTLRHILEHDNLSINVADEPEQAQEVLAEQHIDCLIVDIGFNHGTGINFLADLCQQDTHYFVPVMLYSERDLDPEEQAVLHACEQRFTITAVRSPERLLDAATLFLHQVEANLPPAQQAVLQMMHNKEAIFSGKKVLVVDDDMRNSYALSAALSQKNIDVILAINGQEALSMLDAHSDIALVLMDIMMPEVDGYQAMQQIRAMPQYQRLPIIALTAKAMKGDRAKCIEAGANDYLAKPVDTDKLLSLMRVWLYR